MDTMSLTAKYEDEMIAIRRHIHRHPELSNKEYKTTEFIREKLTEYGVEIAEIGMKTGVVAVIRGGKPGKTVAIREDIDALPMKELTGLPCASENDGACHSCGHDIHTTVLLYCAKVLSEIREELAGTVMLIFQPAEEHMGAGELVDCNFTQVAKPDAFIGLHVSPEIDAGSIGLKKGPANASNDFFNIKIKGKGGHGAHPENCIDPITAAAHIHIALQEINSRELKPGDVGVLTTGRVEAGAASNVIPDVAQMWGTIRTTDPENKTGELIRTRMTEIAQGVAAAFRCTAEVSFADYCPCMVVDKPLAENAMDYMTELLGKGAMDMTALTGGKPGGGSEDFAFVSHEVPTVSMFIAAGGPEQGCCYGQHHPKVRFDDSILYEGSAAFGWFALRWLYDNAGIAF